MPDEPIKESVKLSPSIAKILLEKSPLHAWQAHRLLGGGVDTETDATNDGKIIEDIIFELGKIRVIDADSYRTNAAKDARDEAVLAGKIPVLETKYPFYASVATEISKGLVEHGIKFTGQNQVTVVWKSEEVECKGVIDHQIVDTQVGHYMIYDLKCVENASPAAVQRSIVDYGYDIQHAAYIEGTEAIYPALAGRGKMRFLFCEKDAPHAVNVVELAGSMAELGKRKWERAKALWKLCLAANNWPGYPASRIEAAPWQLSKEEEASHSEASNE